MRIGKGDDIMEEILLQLILVTIGGLIFSIPTYWIYRIVKCISKEKGGLLNNKRFLFNKRWVEGLYTIIVFVICILGFALNFISKETGEQLEKYIEGQYLNIYTPLSFDHILTVIVIFFLGIAAYLIIKAYSDKMAPIPYVICCSILIINIIFTIVYFTHVMGTNKNYTGTENIFLLKIGFILLSMMYIVELKNSMDKVSEIEASLNKVYKNKVLNSIFILFTKYKMMPIFWITISLPVLVIIQLILTLFGQQPDSFIKVFFETSSYNYSKVIPPDPILIPGDGHYLCTVSAKGHEKIVKPLRSGRRRGTRILVNRQLLIANAFENILEQYVPKIHKVIRYIYDKYGYPLSNHINTKYAADITYIIMKPLEWTFLVVLYCVDKNPENRINKQYSDLRY